MKSYMIWDYREIVQFFSISCVTASIIAICWSFCLFGSKTETPLDLMKFIYFRSSRCDARFDWKYLNITDLRGLPKHARELDFVEQSFATRRSLILLNLYLLVNFALVVTALVALCEWNRLLKENITAFWVADGLNRRKGGRHFNYYALCIPWIVMNFIGLALDLFSTYFYSSDYFHILWDFKYVVYLLGVKNPSRNLLQFFVVNEENALETATLATTYTYMFTSKLFLPLLVFLVLGLMSIKSMWEVICDNKRTQTRLIRTLKWFFFSGNVFICQYFII